jgi:peroxiredoxin
VAQFEELASSYREIAKRGARVVMISSQPVEKSRELAAKHDLPIRFMVDPDNEAARQLSISRENSLPFGFQLLGYDSEAALPTVVITDAEGKILFTDLTDNYRHRPEPEKLLKVLDISQDWPYVVTMNHRRGYRDAFWADPVCAGGPLSIMLP